MFALKRGRLILDCRPLAREEAPARAREAERAGATALWTRDPDQTRAVKGACTLPAIAGWEQPDERGVPVLTPDLDSARALAEAGADVIALDATAEARPVPGRLAELIRRVQAELRRPVLAVVANAQEAVRAQGYGVDLVAAMNLAVAGELQIPVIALGGGGRIDGFYCAVVDRLEAPGQAATAESYWAAAADCIARVQASQPSAIRAAAELMAQAIIAGGVVHIFGAGHSRAFGMELSGRAGGLVPMHVFGLEEVAPAGKRGLQLLDLERSPETAHALLATFPVHPADVFVIASNSGRNGCPVELALEVKRRGHGLITVTSLEHAGQVAARHPAGKKVYEVADVVIDNGAPYGDALLSVPGLGERICAVSSVTGALIAQALTAETIRLIQAAGVEPPVYVSANVDGSDRHNAELEARYAGRI